MYADQETEDRAEHTHKMAEKRNGKATTETDVFRFFFQNIYRQTEMALKSASPGSFSSLRHRNSVRLLLGLQPNQQPINDVFDAWHVLLEHRR